MPLQLHPDIFKLYETDARFQTDTRSWWEWRNSAAYDPAVALPTLLETLPEFRSLLRYRLLQAGFTLAALPAKLRLANDLYLVCNDIGGGFRIQHGHSTWVLATKVGENCHVNQNVTIGNARGTPTIGDRVKIHTGAVVVGPITIGNDVVIAPNAFVNFDVPSGKKVFPPRSIVT